MQISNNAFIQMKRQLIEGEMCHYRNITLEKYFEEDILNKIQHVLSRDIPEIYNYTTIGLSDLEELDKNDFYRISIIFTFNGVCGDTIFYFHI